jgi:hypothetical protein
MANGATLTPASFAGIAVTRVPTPLAPRLLFLLLAVGFVIYLPVALFRTTAPLLLLDALLGAAVLATVGSRRSHRFLGGSATVMVLTALYLLSIIPAVLVDRPASPASVLQGLRSSLYGIIALITASAWLDSTQRADRFIRIFVIGGVGVALYAMRQIAFGLLPFEAERVALMGSSGREADILERVRIPSIFGDPATFCFFGMVAVCLLWTAQRRDVLPAVVRDWPKLSFLLLLLGVGSTLTRAPMMGLGVAALWLLFTSDRMNARFLLKLGGIALVGLLVIVGLNYIVLNNVLADSPISWVRSLHNMLTAIWTLVPFAFGDTEITGRLEVLRSGSATARGEAWIEGLNFLLRRPFGGGIGTITEGGDSMLTFSPIDVGYLRFGLELGWLGMLSMFGLWAAVFVQGVRKWRRARDARSHELGRGLLAAWLAIGAAQSVTSFLHTELIAAVAWMIAAMILNLDKIANSESRQSAITNRGDGK